MAELASLSAAELAVRMALGRVALRELAGEDDPRAPEAVARVEAQMAVLQAEVERRNGQDQPAPVVVGLRTLDARARRH